MRQLDGLVESGNTVIVVEHEMRVVAGSDWVIDIGPGAGDEGGTIVAQGTPQELAKLALSQDGSGGKGTAGTLQRKSAGSESGKKIAAQSKTAPYLAKFLGGC